MSYALAIYLLNLFIAFLTPRFDPAQREEDDIGVLVATYHEGVLYVLI